MADQNNNIEIIDYASGTTAQIRLDGEGDVVGQTEMPGLGWQTSTGGTASPFPSRLPSAESGGISSETSHTESSLCDLSRRSSDSGGFQPARLDSDIAELLRSPSGREWTHRSPSDYQRPKQRRIGSSSSADHARRSQSPGTAGPSSLDESTTSDGSGSAEFVDGGEAMRRSPRSRPPNPASSRPEEASQLSRHRKKQLMAELELRTRQLESDNQELRRGIWEMQRRYQELYDVLASCGIGLTLEGNAEVVAPVREPDWSVPIAPERGPSTPPPSPPHIGGEE